MKLLVIFPFYNSSKFIEESIISILNQSVDLKIIAIDDCSTDSSKQILNNISDNRLTIISNASNLGVYQSINRGLYYAESDLSWTHYTIHGSDDISFPNRFSLQFNMFKSLPFSIMAVGCKYNRTVYGKNKIIKTNPKTNESVLIYKREVFDTIGYYDNCLAGGDTEYKLRMSFAFPNSIHQIDKVLITSYLHSNNLTTQIPIGGKYRTDYIKKFKSDHAKMKLLKNYYRSFK